MTIKFDFSGKTAVITGSAKGIGGAIAQKFAESGANVVVVDMDIENGEKMAVSLEKKGIKSIFRRLDISNEAAVDVFAKEILGEFEKIEILVNCAGIGPKDVGPPFLKISSDDIKHVFNVNTVGMVNMCRAFYGNFYAQKSGKIINISSISAFMQVPMMPQYGASKAAAISFSNSLAKEMGSFNINVNCVNPGFVYTDLYHDNGLKVKQAMPQAFDDCSNSEEVVEKMASGSALKRTQTPEDVAYAVLFLASEEAKNITGECLNVDSGILYR
jgi:NAD(P)-dependent dehydrogenase (short-subunit alcohol dehydrogenase family)